jgi:Galactose oxidase, central domain
MYIAFLYRSIPGYYFPTSGSKWSCFLPRRVVVQGPGPSARYAHTLALVANRFLVAMGGNDGKQTLGDAWALDTSDKPYQWRKITDAGETPAARSAGFSVQAAVLSSKHVQH